MQFFDVHYFLFAIACTFGTFYSHFLFNIYSGSTVYGSKHDILAETKAYKFNFLYKSLLNS